ncbi:ABC transporter substrate-binding protein [Candidatus Bipolaricaulota bacterium]
MCNIRRLLAIALVLIATVALAAVGQQQGGTLDYGLTGTIVTIDPGVAVDNAGMTVIRACYDRLVEMTPDGTAIVPGLAASWTISDDGLIYTFFLVENATFHDGSAVTADAVRYSLDRSINLGKGWSDMLIDVLADDGITVVGDYEIVIQLSKSTPFFLDLLALAGPASVLNPAIVEANITDEDPFAEDFLFENTAGSGAFKFIEWSHGQYLAMERNDGYWGAPAYLDQLILRSVPEASTASTMIQGGDLDIAGNLPAEIFAVLGAREDVNILSSGTLGFSAFYFNCEDEILSSKLVRQALSYAYDYDTALAIAGPVGKPSNGLLMPGMMAYDADRKAYDQNLIMARGLLAQAGYPNGFTMTCLYPAWGTIPDLMVVAQAAFAQIGVTMEIQEVSFGPYLEAINNGSSPMFAWEGSPALNDPHAHLYARVHSSQIDTGSGGNINNFRNAAVDALLVAGLNEVDQAKRAEIYAQVDRILFEDAISIWNWQEVDVRAIRSDVYGFIMPVIGVVDFSVVYMDAQ